MAGGGEEPPHGHAGAEVLGAVGEYERPKDGLKAGQGSGQGAEVGGRNFGEGESGGEGQRGHGEVFGGGWRGHGCQWSVFGVG